MIKVTFDRNVWKKICSSDRTDDPVILVIQAAIKASDIDGYIPEVAFTFEGLEKKLRQTMLSTYEAKIDCAIDMDRPDEEIGLDFLIGPNVDAYPGNSPELLQELQGVRAWGFKLLCCVRVAKITNPAIEESLYVRRAKDESYETIYRFAECAEAIENLGGGISHIKRIGETYCANWRLGIGHAPAMASKKIAAAMAEWADGDSVAAHYAYGNDYFCTRDIGKSAGASSVLAPNFRAALEERLGIRVVSPEALCELIAQFIGA